MYGVNSEDFTEKGERTVIQNIRQAVANIHNLDELNTYTNSGVKGRHNPNFYAVQVDFDNATLFLDTLADCLAWILSVSVHPGPQVKSVTEKDFFLPLLGLYGTWIQHFYLDEVRDVVVEDLTAVKDSGTVEDPEPAVEEDLDTAEDSDLEAVDGSEDDEVVEYSKDSVKPENAGLTRSSHPCSIFPGGLTSNPID